MSLHSPQDADLQELERPSKRMRRSTANLNTAGHREVGLMRKSVGDNYASFLGSASGIHFIRAVYTAAEDKQGNAKPPQETPESNLVPGEEDRLTGDNDSSFEARLWQPHEAAASDLSGITFDEMLELSKSYFDNWHPAYPFLHAPSVLEMFENLSHGIPIASTSSEHAFGMAIVRSIFSISWADRKQLGHISTPIPEVLVFSSFKHATDSIDLVLSMRTSIMSLQALLCVQLFLVSMLRHNAASRLGGLVTRMAFHLGLHRCPTRYAAFTPQEAQLRRRIFWSIYCIDRHICQSLGLPLTLRDDDIDVCFFDEEQHDHRLVQSYPVDDRLQLLNLLSKHAQVKGLILEFLHKSIPYRQTYSDRAAQIQSKLAKWSNNIEDLLDTDTDQANVLTPFHRLMLDVLKQECIIALNRPQLAESKDDAGYQAALQTCVGAARTVITSMFNFIKIPTGVSTEHERGPRTPLIWPSSTWAVWMSAFILIYAAIEKEIPANVAVRLTDRSLEILRHLSTRGSVWPKACEIAIWELRARLNRTNGSLKRSVTSAFRPAEGSHGIVPEQSNGSTPDVPVTVSKLPREHESPVYLVRDDPNDSRSGIPSHPSIGSGAGEELTVHADASLNILPDGRTIQKTPLPPVDERSHIDRQNLPPIGSSQQDLRSHWNDPQQVPRLGNSILPEMNTIDFFQGFEIPFWMGDDQYTDLINS